MRYPAEETAQRHAKILDEASRLFRDRGFAGVGVVEIMKAAGLTHGSFYNHFDSKQALISECVGHAATKSLSDIKDRDPTAAGRDQYVVDYLSLAHRDDPGSGCLMSALATEVAKEPTVRPSMSGFVTAFIETLRAQFPWKARSRAREEAIQTTATLVGAMILARAVDDDALSREILQVVSDGLRRANPKA